MNVQAPQRYLFDVEEVALLVDQGMDIEHTVGRIDGYRVFSIDSLVDTDDEALFIN